MSIYLVSVRGPTCQVDVSISDMLCYNTEPMYLYSHINIVLFCKYGEFFNIYV